MPLGSTNSTRCHILSYSFVIRQHTHFGILALFFSNIMTNFCIEYIMLAHCVLWMDMHRQIRESLASYILNVQPSLRIFVNGCLNPGRDLNSVRASRRCYLGTLFDVWHVAICFHVVIGTCALSVIDNVVDSETWRASIKALSILRRSSCERKSVLALKLE